MRSLMRFVTTSLLTASLLLATLPLLADELPMLPSSSPAQLPSLSSATTSMVDPDRSLSVTCYLGNPNDRNSLGDITVRGPESAGPTCNSLYFSCKGRCFGCFSDFDLSQDICVDSSGRKFLR
jgi:hypothetical protein